MKERRHDPRIPLEHIFYLSTVSAGRKVPSVLLDITLAGARVGLPPDEPLPTVGSEVILRDASVLASFLENRAATVMWSMGVQFGIRFTEPLDVNLEDMAKLLQSEIFY